MLHIYNISPKQIYLYIDHKNTVLFIAHIFQYSSYCHIVLIELSMTTYRCIELMFHTKFIFIFWAASHRKFWNIKKRLNHHNPKQGLKFWLCSGLNPFLSWLPSVAFSLWKIIQGCFWLRSESIFSKDGLPFPSVIFYCLQYWQNLKFSSDVVIHYFIQSKLIMLEMPKNWFSTKVNAYTLQSHIRKLTILMSNMYIPLIENVKKIWLFLCFKSVLLA